MTRAFTIFKYVVVGIACVAGCSLIFAATTMYVVGNENSSTRNDGISSRIFFSNAGESSLDAENEAIARFDETKRRRTIDCEKYLRTIRRVREICGRNDEAKMLRNRHFLYSPKHGALYCWIRKVASTSFTKLFGELRGRRVTKNYYKEIKYLAPSTPDELRKIIRDGSVFKFLLVRHPFERLVSSYRNRIEDNSGYTAQAWKHVPRIFHATRPELYRSNGTIGNALQRIFDDHRRLKLIPTFGEFVTWLLKELPANDDEHWNQYHNHCSLCNVDYDYILKIENFTNADVNYVFSKIGIEKNFTILPKLQSTRGGSTDFSRTCQYFANLSRDEAFGLYERYKTDFDMFDYEYEPYLNCATVGKTTAS